MKFKFIKKIAVLLIVFLLCGNMITMASNDIRVFVDNEKVSFDVAPRLIGGRTMVPLRAIFEALGAEVLWDETTQTVTAFNEAYLVEATIDKKTMYVNNTEKTMDIAPMIVNNRTLVPARFIAEAFNCNVVWSAEEFSVYITTNPIDYEELEKGNSNKPESKTIYFENLSPSSSARYTGNEGDSFIDTIGRRNGNEDIYGKQYEHGLTAWVARWNYKSESSWVWNEYDINGEFKTLKGDIVLIKSYNENNFNTQIKIIGDGEVLYSKILTPSSLPIKNIEVDVSGVNQLKIHLQDLTSVSGGTAFGLANFRLNN